MKIDTVERTCIEAIIETARQGDWISFKELADEPFINEDAMKEAFEMCAAAIQTMSDVRVEAVAQLAPDNVRMIHGTITEANLTRFGISLILRSIRRDGRHRFGIWVFAPMPNWGQSAC